MKEYVIEPGVGLADGEAQHFGLDSSETYGVEVFDVTEMRDGYRVTNAERCRLIWFPHLRRGAVVWGADPFWADAPSPAALAGLFFRGEHAASAELDQPGRA